MCIVASDFPIEISIGGNSQIFRTVPIESTSQSRTQMYSCDILLEKVKELYWYEARGGS